MYVEITTAPAAYPVSVFELRDHLIIDHSDDDFLLERYLRAAISELDPPHGILGRAMIDQTLKVHLKEFTTRIYLPYPPLDSVTSVKYYDSDGVEQTVNSNNYEVITHQEPGYIVIKDGESWPTGIDDIEYPINIIFKAGYGATASDVPEGIRFFIMLNVAEMYKERELTQNMAVKRNVHWFNLIEKYRFRFSGRET